jgi:AhpD family alkylhydroperoxidase
LSLDYKFKTMLFWIVSRTNNCQYCMGHQESKLLGAGMTEDEIAGLDGDWLEFTPAERSAFALARKLTYEPHRISDTDIDRVREHYTDLQILEMILSMSFNNSINRWKEGVGVPQSANGGGFGRTQPGTTGAAGGAGGGAPATGEARPTNHSYLTPTSEAFQKKITEVAPVAIDEKTGKPTHMTVCKRPALEPRDEVEAALAEGRERKPRLPLVDESTARAILPADWSEGSLPQWVLLIANFPVDGLSRIVAQRAADEKGDLSPLLKAQVSWTIARQDRAWYAVGQAKQRLNDLGWSDDQIYALDGNWSEFTPAEQALFTVARKLAATPVVLTDADVARALKLTGPREVVQLVSYVTTRASFDRITEAAGLTVDR